MAQGKTTSTVLDNVANTTAATVITRKREVAVWVTSGACDVSYDGATLVSLTVGDYKLITLGEGAELTFTATSGSTTAKIKHIMQVD